MVAARRERYSDNPAVRHYFDAIMDPYGVERRALDDVGGDGPEAECGYDDGRGEACSTATHVPRGGQGQAPKGA